MSENPAPVSIENSNAWFFAIIGSIVAPWIALPDSMEVLGLVVMLIVWTLALGIWMRQEHLRFKAWLAQQDIHVLEKLVSNYRIGSIRQRAVRAEIASRSSSHNASLPQ